MAAMSQKTRDELSKIYRDERIDERCLITKRLYQEANTLTESIDVSIKDAQARIDGAIEERNVIVERRKELLRDNQLFGLMYEVDNKHRTCKLEETHPDILKFDVETNTGRREILERQ